MLGKRRDKFAEKRKRRIGDNDISIAHQFDTFYGAEIAITLQVLDFTFIFAGA